MFKVNGNTFGQEKRQCLHRLNNQILHYKCSERKFILQKSVLFSEINLRELNNFILAAFFCII